MKRLLFILLILLVFMAGNSIANESHSSNLLNNLQLFSKTNVCSAIDIAIDQFFIDEQENNDFDGFSFFVDDPDIQMIRISNKGFTIHPVILFTPKIKVITLITDLPPPRFS